MHSIVEAYHLSDYKCFLRTLSLFNGCVFYGEALPFNCLLDDDGVSTYSYMTTILRGCSTATTFLDLATVRLF